jgi:hypothetical protein
MPDDLLSEATALADHHAGADPIVEAAKGAAEVELVLAMPEPATGPQPDPDAGTPYSIDDGAAMRVAIHMPEVVAEVGVAGVASGLDAMRAMPREVLGAMDESGLVGSPSMWVLLGHLGQRMAKADPAEVAACEKLPSVGDLEAFAAEMGYPLDEDAPASNVRVFLEALPAAARVAFAPLLADWRIWDLADHLGEKLWSYEAVWPLRGPPKPEPAPPDPMAARAADVRSRNARFAAPPMPPGVPRPLTPGPYVPPLTRFLGSYH